MLAWIRFNLFHTDLAGLNRAQPPGYFYNFLIFAKAKLTRYSLIGPRLGWHTSTTSSCSLPGHPRIPKGQGHVYAVIVKYHCHVSRFFSNSQFLITPQKQGKAYHDSTFALSCSSCILCCLSRKPESFPGGCIV